MSDPRSWNEAPSVRTARGTQRAPRGRQATAAVPLTFFVSLFAACSQGPDAYQLSLSQPAGLDTPAAAAPDGGAGAGGWASAPLGGDGCFASITRTAKDAGEYVSTTALPTLTARLQGGLSYAREVAVPAAVDGAKNAQAFVSETALPYARTVLLPALADGYAYARDVALPAVVRSWEEGGAAHRARTAAAAAGGGSASASASASASGGGPVAAEDGHTVKPQHGVPAMAGHDDVLPHGGGAAAVSSDGGYASISNVMHSAVAPGKGKEQQAPLLTDVPIGVHDIDRPPTD
jgi:hypothetical protein